MATSWICSPRDSCQAVVVQLPGGRFDNLNSPSPGVIAWCEFFHDREGALHPRMDIALHGDEFRARLLVLDRRRTGRPRFFPLAIVRRQRVNVARRPIVIEVLEILVDLAGQNMRRVAAASPRENGRLHLRRDPMKNRNWQ
jgi:hypothetical protein